ncbi:MAG TPA: MarR family winged helix-turn-helix transcriptional regulator [Bryobacteraceae bacterium]|jgi:DNA-binding MarR family transcriptional regulator
MTSGLSLSALLSQALVAFTIECDNEFEHQMPHRTTHFGGSRQDPWLVSIVMWWNLMRFVSPEGIRVAELEELALTETNLNGMVRWGYVTVAPDPADTRPKRPKSASLIRATAEGRHAQEVWQPLPATIEKCWQTRFGKATIGSLRESLRSVVERIPFDLPNCLPILGYGLFYKGRVRLNKERRNSSGTPALPVLLSRVLLAFALAFERESDLSLAIYANILRVLDEKGVRVSDLPGVTGVSKEAISVALGFLEKTGAAVVGTDPSGGRSKLARLTPKGRQSLDSCRQLLQRIEGAWETRFGADAIRSLRQALETLAGDSSREKSPLFQGLVPYPDGWRAQVRQPETLPHFPMVLHRGGFPDGS